MEQLVTVTNQSKTQKGRKPTTGKYNTREELEINIFRLLGEERLSKSSIARVCKVSPAVVVAVVESTE